MVFNGCTEKENIQVKNSGENDSATPNKAHSEVISIPETPASSLPTPPENKTSQKRQQERRRRRARILSSSEEDEVEPTACAHPSSNKNCSLFATLPTSKRRKKETHVSEESEHGPQQKSASPVKPSTLHSNPKRLFHNSRNGEANDPLLSHNCSGPGKETSSNGQLEKGVCIRS